MIKLRSYTEADLPAFKLAVEALTLVYTAPADLKPTSRRSLIESASGMLRRFGADPASRVQVDAAPDPEPEDVPDDPLDEFDQTRR